jgi:flagellin-like protein
MKFTKLIRSKKAISPIFATLILIAIAVIAGIVVYMFTSGTMSSMTGGGTAGQDKVAIVAVEPGTGAADVYAKSTAGTDVIIDGAVVKDSGGTTVDVVAISPTVTLDANGATNVVNVTSALLTTGDVFTITLTSDVGGSYVSASFQMP